MNESIKQTNLIGHIYLRTLSILECFLLLFVFSLLIIAIPNYSKIKRNNIKIKENNWLPQVFWNCKQKPSGLLVIWGSSKGIAFKKRRICKDSKRKWWCKWKQKKNTIKETMSKSNVLKIKQWDLIKTKPGSEE